MKPAPTLRWFGPDWGSHLNRECPQCKTPFDEKCVHCEEGFEADDQGIVTCDGSPFHEKCFMRTIVGSAAHQLKKCSCYGGDWEDPPELSKREAARLAVELWEQNQRNQNVRFPGDD